MIRAASADETKRVKERTLFIFPPGAAGGVGWGAEGGSDFTVFGDDRAGRPTHWAGMLGAPAGDFQSAGLQHVHSTVAGPESSFLGDQGALMGGVLDVGAVALSLHFQLLSGMGRGGKEKGKCGNYYSVTGHNL